MASELAEAIVDAADRLHKREESPDVAAALVYKADAYGTKSVGFKSYSEDVSGEESRFYDYFEAISYFNKNGLQLMRGKSAENLMKIGNDVHRSLKRPEYVALFQKA
jgi:hypothetical protein